MASPRLLSSLVREKDATAWWRILCPEELGLRVWQRSPAALPRAGRPETGAAGALPVLPVTQPLFIGVLLQSFAVSGGQLSCDL